MPRQSDLYGVLKIGLGVTGARRCAYARALTAAIACPGVCLRSLWLVDYGVQHKQALPWPGRQHVNCICRIVVLT